MANFDEMRFAVEALTGGKNTVLLDDMDMPSIMVKWEKQKLSSIMAGGSDAIHPGSIVNGVEKTMYVSKYQNIIMNDRAYSLPFMDPATYLNFDNAVSASRAKGEGWGLMPYSLWCEIALWCRKNGTMPRGNNNFGSDASYPHEVGTPSCELDSSGKVQRTATGSGPATWNHNWQPDGISDLNGNVWEWCAGMRLKDGVIQIIPNANCMDPEVSLSASSTYWKEINSSGVLVDQGSTDTLKWDWVSGRIQLTNGAVSFAQDAGNGIQYKDMAIASGLTAPELAKALLLYPDEPNGDYGGDHHWMNTRGERLPYCGGAWFSTSDAGVFFVNLYDVRGGAYGDLGFRSAFCDLKTAA